MQTNALLQRLRQFPADLRRQTEQFGERALNRVATEGSWRARQILHHIADVTMFWFNHLRSMLIHRNPTLPGLDQDKIARLADYQLTDIRTTLAIVEGVYERMLVLCRNLKEDDWQRSGTHEKYGEMSFAKALEHLLNHNEHHLKQVDTIVKGE